MKLLLIDNYDSFTYNLEHYLTALDCRVEVRRNKEIALEEVAAFDAVVLSPGPGLPKDAGICMPLIEQYHRSKPILGVCLGAQALAEYFGAELYNQKEVSHGVSRIIHREEKSWLLRNLEESFSVGLYHSWAIKVNAKFRKTFRPVAYRGNGVLMAFESDLNCLAGVQFHPESIMTVGGREMLQNWLTRIKEMSKKNPD